MNLTIIPNDSTVYKDGKSFSDLILVDIPENVHALQWTGESGWIEFVNESEFRKQPNETITELPAWAISAMGKWDAANDEANRKLQEEMAAAPERPSPIPVTVA